MQRGTVNTNDPCGAPACLLGRGERRKVQPALSRASPEWKGTVERCQLWYMLSHSSSGSSDSSQTVWKEKAHTCLIPQSGVAKGWGARRCSKGVSEEGPYLGSEGTAAFYSVPTETQLLPFVPESRAIYNFHLASWWFQSPLDTVWNVVRDCPLYKIGRGGLQNFEFKPFARKWPTLWPLGGRNSHL